jgi:hypothetical protein
MKDHTIFEPIPYYFFKTLLFLIDPIIFFMTPYYFLKIPYYFVLTLLFLF